MARIARHGGAPYPPQSLGISMGRRFALTSATTGQAAATAFEASRPLDTGTQAERRGRAGHWNNPGERGWRDSNRPSASRWRRSSKWASGIKSRPGRSTCVPVPSMFAQISSRGSQLAEDLEAQKLVALEALDEAWLVGPRVAVRVGVV
eukprot:g3198.t1